MNSFRRSGVPPEVWRLPLTVDRRKYIRVSDHLWKLPVGTITAEIMARLEESIANSPQPYVEPDGTAVPKSNGHRPAKTSSAGRAGKQKPIFAEGTRELIEGEGEEGKAAAPGSAAVERHNSAAAPGHAGPPPAAPPAKEGEGEGGEELDPETLAMLRKMDAGG